VMQKSLAQMFNTSAATAHAAFPNELENLIVLTTSLKYPIIYAAPEIIDHLTNNIAAVKEALKNCTNHLNAKNIVGTSNHSYFLKGEKIKIIALNKSSINNNSTSSTQKITYIFEHEMGHLVIKNGLSPDKHLAECAADAYAALRHIQIFGKKTDFFEYYSDRASTIVLGISPIHYTDDVIEKVKQLSEKINISNLSLSETTKLAEKIAQENNLNKETLQKISKAFLPVKKAYEKNEKLNESIFLKCIIAMLICEDDSDIFKAGKRFLNHPDFKKYLKNKTEKDSNWKNALNLIENHQIEPTQKIPPKECSTPASQISL